MKFERLNENQIRCTLTKNDLLDRELKISELAYGSEKAKSLFRDMMRQASRECGFEADDIPLMIEAVPISSECVVLTITKVEDPEELDIRFSKFAPDVTDDIEEIADENATEDIWDLYHRVNSSDGHILSNTQASKHKDRTAATATPKRKKDTPVPVCVYQFDSLDPIIRLAHVVSDFPIGRNSLYKDIANNCYELVIDSEKMSAEHYNKLYNIAAEYGRYIPNHTPTDDYRAEHLDPICMDHALQAMAIV